MSVTQSGLKRSFDTAHRLAHGPGYTADPRVRMATTIRNADVRDSPIVAAIYVESWNRGFSGLMPSRSVTEELVTRWRRALAEAYRSRWWVAQMDTEIVGFVGVGPSRDPSVAHLGELDTIAVRPTCWRQGTGRALMAVALDQLAADCYDEAFLWTLAEPRRVTPVGDEGPSGPPHDPAGSGRPSRREVYGSRRAIGRAGAWHRWHSR